MKENKEKEIEVYDSIKEDNFYESKNPLKT